MSCARFARELASQQRPDGGWAQTPTRQSDAYATGEALVALRRAGVDPADPAYQRGLRFLLETQLPDGTWHVETRLHEPDMVSPPYFETGFPHGADQIISCMATAWAVTALAEALPRVTPGAPLIDAQRLGHQGRACLGANRAGGYDRGPRASAGCGPRSQCGDGRRDQCSDDGRAGSGQAATAARARRARVDARARDGLHGVHGGREFSGGDRQCPSPAGRGRERRHQAIRSRPTSVTDLVCDLVR